MWSFAIVAVYALQASVSQGLPRTRKNARKQGDSDSLPEYDIPDQILYNYIELRQSPADLVASGFDETTVKRVLRMVNMNEWNEEKVRTIGGKLKGMEDAIITITQMDQPGSLIYEGSIISARKNSAFKITTSNGQVFFEKTEKDKIIVTD